MKENTCCFIGDRDKRLVNESGYCVCYLNNLEMRTRDMILYAEKKGLHITRIPAKQGF